MNNVHNIEERQPHISSMAICLKCYHRWIAVRPEETKLVDLECPCCLRQGFTIETGEIIDDE